MIRHQLKTLSNFTRAVYSQSPCFRPENESQLQAIATELTPQTPLARGAGLSYSDCCLNQDKPIIDCRRLNHFISFDEATGLLVCQPGITFAELFSVHPDFTPPVIPGTLKATLGGGIANDIHGKNNHQAGTLGHHLKWLELQLGNQVIHCSRNENPDLFSASIGGLGLTGVIKRLAITLKKASSTLQVEKHRLMTWNALLAKMRAENQQYEYQVAWLDLLNESEHAMLSQANHCLSANAMPPPKALTLPPLPIRLINSFSIRHFNRFYFQITKTKKQIVSLQEFNNPLDRINHWNRLYGKPGLLQFQAVFEDSRAHETLHELRSLIHTSRAIPTLAVLKYFTQPGAGLLSFVQPGFTVAIDFIHTHSAIKAIQRMNEAITIRGGKVYLGKDLFLTPQQFKKQYAEQVLFKKILNNYHCAIESNLSRRLNLGMNR